MKAYALIELLMRLPEYADVQTLDALGAATEIKVTVTGKTAVVLPSATRESRDPLTLNAFQDYAWAEAIYPEHGNGSTQSITIALTGVVGESGKALNTWHDTLRGGEALSAEIKQQLAVSLAHTMWYCAALAKELGVTFSDLGGQSIRQARAWRREQEHKDSQQNLAVRGPGAVLVDNN